MAIEDYVPNIFGGVPVGYEGLLGAEQSAALQKRSNLAGLLGFGAALAQGMGAGGARRSALQNVLTAAAQGFSGAGQTYEAGIGQMINAQKIKQTQSDLARQQQAREAVEKVIKTPEVANNPTMVAYFRANPDKALERYINIEEGRLARGITTRPEAAPTIPPADLMGMKPEGTEVIGSRYQQQLKEAEAAQAYFSRTGNTERAKAAREEADSLRNLMRQEELAGSVPKSLANVHPMLQPMVDALNENAISMTPAEIQSAISEIRKKDADFRLNSETDLRKEFAGLPAIKEFSTVQTAHKQVINALNNPSAANDLAAATKFMKLLDPGSVVRDTYGQIRQQYVDLAKGYNLNPDNIVLKQGKASSTPTPAAESRPEGVGRDWRLSVDANGNRAYVSPDGTQFKEVK